VIALREVEARRHRGRRLGLELSATAVAVALCAGALAGCGGGEETGAPTAPPATGAEIWASQGCGGCHTLSAADASAKVGPNLDETRLSAEEIAAIVADGRNQMPGFSASLSEEDIAAVAAYVSESAAAAQSP
jgi:mono/diheme cytochrome c family protein